MFVVAQGSGQGVANAGKVGGGIGVIATAVWQVRKKGAVILWRLQPHQSLDADLLLGEEKTTPAMHPGKPADFEVFPQSLRTKIADFLQNGGSLIVSGAHFASDLVEGKEREHPDIAFAKDVLKIRWVTNHAARNGSVSVIDSTVFPGISNVQFNSEFSEKIYRVEAPDAFAPADSLGKVVMRYAENGRPAAIFFSDNSRMFAFGFPLETVSITERKLLFKHMLHQLNPGHFPPSQE